MSLGFVNDTHRGVREAHISSRQQNAQKWRSPNPPVNASTEETNGVVPLVDSRSKSMPLAEFQETRHTPKTIPPRSDNVQKSDRRTKAQKMIVKQEHKFASSNTSTEAGS